MELNKLINTKRKVVMTELFQLTDQELIEKKFTVKQIYKINVLKDIIKDAKKSSVLYPQTIHDPETIYTVIKNYFLDNQFDWNKEHFLLISLNVRNKIISIRVIGIGTLTSTSMHPREVYKPAILNSAAQIMVAHNHPSEDPNPSEDDIKFSRRLLDAGKILGIELIDHIIFTQEKHYSFKATGLI